MTDEQERPALSATELAVLQLLATGATNREIAHERGISEATVKKHVTNINNKLGTGNRTEAARRALELGLVTVETSEAAAGIDSEAARRLADELERARAKSRRVTQAFVAVALIVFLAVLLAFAFGIFNVEPPFSPNPTATPRPRPTAVANSPGWLPGRRLPTGRTGITLISDGRGVYAIGGEDSSGVLSDTLLYDIEIIDWRRAAFKPTAVRDSGAVWIDHRFVVPGGCLADGSATDVVEIYDPRSDTWSSAAPLPEPACGFALVEYGGRAYLLGGRSGADTASSDDRVWRYEPESGEWLDQGRLPLKRSDLAAVVVGDQIHVLGGLDGAGRPQASHWVFSPLDLGNQWNTEGGPTLPQPRAGLVAAALLRSVYVMGGGWDQALDNGSLMWDATDPDAGWQPFVDPRGPTPQRGLGLAVHQGQWLHTAGGEVDGRYLDLNQSIRVVWRIQPPQPPR